MTWKEYEDLITHVHMCLFSPRWHWQGCQWCFHGIERSSVNCKPSEVQSSHLHDLFFWCWKDYKGKISYHKKNCSFNLSGKMLCFAQHHSGPHPLCLLSLFYKMFCLVCLGEFGYTSNVISYNLWYFGLKFNKSTSKGLNLSLHWPGWIIPQKAFNTFCTYLCIESIQHTWIPEEELLIPCTTSFWIL